MKLIQELLKENIISQDKAKELELQMQKSADTEEELIVRSKILPEEDLFRLKAKLLNLPFFKLDKDEEIPLDILELISEEAAVNYKMIPLYKKGNTIGVGMVYPEDISAQN